MMGSRHFNDLRRGLPRMSPTLLSKRLQTLVRAGVVARWEDGNRVCYQLSQAGKELEPIVEALGSWGIRWVPEIGDEDLDPHLLLWDIHRSIAVESLPRRTHRAAFRLHRCARREPSMVDRHHHRGS